MPRGQRAGANGLALVNLNHQKGLQMLCAFLLKLPHKLGPTPTPLAFSVEDPPSDAEHKAL